ncbi:sulfite exporter TauE/SafE family protein [Campylobacter fetus]|uniref:sulfite exporter TauE/SafE family protein n=1 Tax=Campylobacter fetus TaxID=196 RepID=UPI000FCA4B86|nr:sulfite exporter TauE/SafE family protein [Campylobacter fetus]QQF52895.1 sulfite exporter TauE/SafE family protein [Campylobacter fetus subsp. venerealis]RUT49957.1 hypothetical protein BWK67_06345 [Campylobacter fetus]RUT50218.1 hypothetical protein BWK51_06325 [Campylobacter fetus]
MDISTVFSIISIALMFSISHCIGMCGGFVMAYNAKLSNKTRKEIVFLSISYHLSRVFAYVCLGILFGFFGSIVILNLKTKGFVFFIVGIFLVILSIALIKRGKLLAFIENDKIGNLIMRFFKKFSKRNDAPSFMILGFLNGLLPCGVVYYFLALSLSSGSIFNGFLVMFIFGLSTLPVMLIFSGTVGLVSAKFKHTMTIATSVIIAIYGVYLSYLGFMAIK